MSDDEMRALLMSRTASEIRSVARTLGVTLGYSASRKATAADEIVAWMRHNDYPETDLTSAVIKASDHR